MKNTLLLALLLSSATAFSQGSKTTVKEFTLSLPVSTVEMNSSDSKKITYVITRSKGFTKSKGYMNVATNLPAGFSISFEPVEGIFENGEATITTQNAAPGTYNIILNATLSNKKKGSILTVLVP